jgi:putative endopeptidase
MHGVRPRRGRSPQRERKLGDALGDDVQPRAGRGATRRDRLADDLGFVTPGLNVKPKKGVSVFRAVLSPRRLRRGALFSAAGLAALLCAAASSPSPAAGTGGTATDPGLTTPHYGSWGFDASGEDRAAKPGDDFFRYANGTYVDNMVIPADRARFGAFDTLTVLSENRVHAILEDAAASGAALDSPRGKIGAFYRAYMDDARIDALGAQPLKADLEIVRAAGTREDIAAVMGRHDLFGDSIFGANVSPDAKDPTHYVLNMGTNGMGLPDKDYYLKPSFAAKKAAYQAYIARLLTLAGWPEPEARASDIVAFETRLAEASWDRADRRDRDKTYNPMTLAELSTYAPGFDFHRFLEAGGLGQADRAVLSDNTAFPKKAAIFAQTPLPVLKAWLAFTMTDSAAPYLSKPFSDARFEFRNKTLSGQPEQPARWKRAVAATNTAMGEAVGQIYVERYFTPEAKAQMLQLVGNLKGAFAARIQKLDWMSSVTKQRALDKLGLFTVKIAYTDTWRDYSALQISPNDLYGDAKRAEEFEWKRRARRLGGPVDRAEWGMTPQTVNAYYNSTMNEIVFPAAILQPPFFDPKADMAINYGAIGGVIGHEMSHGFDDQGRKSDGNGRLRDWWTSEDGAKFDAKAKALGAQYSAFEPLPGEHINGQLTMGENIGDMGGINLALEAYHRSLGGKPAPVVDGLTGDQRVFLGWAQVWRGKNRDDALIQRLHTDPHSPETARVNAVVRNVDAWYDAFGVKPGDKLYVAPQDRVHIW